ncbi:F-box/LRR-repeat protein 4 [Acorus gramineus]|uniref:F-box/LRR-repeat protein 4 n=1 Tax=Acorus gramineus TaxID=55184 RepID=A0AAV8ZYY1_ACOGR|nr:F-box/LRR-repeat protein 4 [Acorus gramineus]
MRRDSSSPPLWFLDLLDMAINSEANRTDRPTHFSTVSLELSLKRSFDSEYYMNNATPPQPPPLTKPRCISPLSTVRHQTKGRDLINTTLPDECISHIFSFLPSTRDRFSCAAVSQKWLSLQASTRSSETNKACTDKEISRCLEGKAANDTRLAAVAVGASARGTLTDLRIRGTYASKGITDAGLCVIARACPTLKSLTLWDCPLVGAEGLKAVAQSCKTLEKLDLCGLSIVDDSGLITVAENCLNLTSISIRSCACVGDESLEALARRSFKLESVSLVKCPNITDSGVFSMALKLPKLEKLKLSFLKVKDGALKGIGKSPIRVLCLENLPGLTGNGFSSSLGSSEAVEVISVSLSEEGEAEEELLELSTLETLSLKKCPGVGDLFLSRIACACKFINNLALVGLSSVTDRGVSSILNAVNAKKKTLVSLDLSGCSRITDWTVVAASKLFGERLRSVSFDGCLGLTDRSLEAIRESCHGLEEVDLSWCVGVTDEGVLSLASAKHQTIKVLSLAGCTGITDRGLGFIEMMMCGSLVGLNVKKCSGLSREGIESFREILWWCDLIC